MRAKFCLLALTCALLARVWAQDNASAAQSKVLALESAWNMAEERGDTRALDMIFDNAMVYIDEDGSLLSKVQFLARVKGSGPQVTSLVTETIGVRVYGEMAIVAGSYRAKGIKQGKAFQREGRFIDTWVFKQGSWVCVVAQATPVQR